MKVSDRLKSFLDENTAKKNTDLVLSESGKHLLRALKSAGERATKGRDIDSHYFDSNICEDSTETIRMLMEGRHSMSIGRQLVKRFEGMEGIESVEVLQTKRGAKVVIRPTKKELSE
jgi:hypothetical protein